MTNPKTESGSGSEKRLLIGGCIDGTLVVFDWRDDARKGRVTFSLQVVLYRQA